MPFWMAWRIPWTEEPGRLQSKGSQRVGHALKVGIRGDKNPGKEGIRGDGAGIGVQGGVSQCSALFGGCVSFLLLL